MAVLRQRGDWISRFIREQGVQTNEVQRSWMLLPCFLEIARRAGVEVLDLVELGPSAGLNLVWDRYRYHYEVGAWGAEGAPLELSGDERRPVPRELLAQRPVVRHRRGIDLSPIDVTREEDALLLKAFVWADQTERLERLDQAVETLRADPPKLEQGHIADRLPAVLAERKLGALTIVFETAVLGYVGEEQERVVAALEAAGREFPLAFVWTARPTEDEHTFYGLWLRLWPDGEKVLLAHAGFHGQWLEWLGEPV